MKQVWEILCILYNTAKVAVGATIFASQTCGEHTAYFCPADFNCRHDRSNRCTSKETCEYPNNDDNCWRHPHDPDAYLVQLGHIKVRDYIPETKLVSHHYINYKGFTYKFGPYKVQILDTNDNIYKYKGTSNKSLKAVGYSYCSFAEANIFARMWTMRKYHLVANNCQHFAKAFKKYLTTGMCSQKRWHTSRNHLEIWANHILLDCRMVCCEGGWSSRLSALLFYYTVITTIFHVY